MAVVEPAVPTRGEPAGTAAWLDAVRRVAEHGCTPEAALRRAARRPTSRAWPRWQLPGAGLERGKGGLTARMGLQTGSSGTRGDRPAAPRTAWLNLLVAVRAAPRGASPASAPATPSRSPTARRWPASSTSCRPGAGRARPRAVLPAAGSTPSRAGRRARPPRPALTHAGRVRGSRRLVTVPRMASSAPAPRSPSRPCARSRSPRGAELGALRRHAGGARRGRRRHGRRRLRADREQRRGRRARGAGRARRRPAAGDRPGGAAAGAVRRPGPPRHHGGGGPHRRVAPARRGADPRLARRAPAGRRGRCSPPRRPRRPRRSPAARWTPRCAAPIAAEQHGLAVLADDVADNAGAVTRFVLRRPPGPPPPPTGQRPHVARRHHGEPAGRAARRAHRAGRARDRPQPHRVAADQGPARRVLVPPRLHRARRRAGDGRGAGRAAPAVRPVRFLGSYPHGDGPDGPPAPGRRRAPGTPSPGGSGAERFAAAAELARRAARPGRGVSPGRLVLVRHGLTDANVRHVLDTRPPGPAAERARSGPGARARRAARRLAGHAACSPPPRCGRSRPPSRSRPGTGSTSRWSTGSRRCSPATSRAAPDEPRCRTSATSGTAWRSRRSGRGAARRGVGARRARRFLPGVETCASAIPGDVVLVSHGAAIRLAAGALLGDRRRPSTCRTPGRVVLRPRRRTGWGLESWEDAPPLPGDVTAGGDAPADRERAGLPRTLTAQPQPSSCRRSSLIPKWCAISCTTVTVTSSQHLVLVARTPPRRVLVERDPVRAARRRTGWCARSARRPRRDPSRSGSSGWRSSTSTTTLSIAARQLGRDCPAPRRPARRTAGGSWTMARCRSNRRGRERRRRRRRDGPAAAAPAVGRAGRGCWRRRRRRGSRRRRRARRRGAADSAGGALALGAADAGAAGHAGSVARAPAARSSPTVTGPRTEPVTGAKPLRSGSSAARLQPTLPGAGGPGLRGEVVPVHSELLLGDHFGAARVVGGQLRAGGLQEPVLVADRRERGLGTPC